jgi:hypothetical protein
MSDLMVDPWKPGNAIWIECCKCSNPIDQNTCHNIPGEHEDEPHIWYLCDACWYEMVEL